MAGRVLGEWEDKQCSTLVDNALSVNSPCLLCYVHNILTRPSFGTCAILRVIFVDRFCVGITFGVISGFYPNDVFCLF